MDISTKQAIYITYTSSDSSFGYYVIDNIITSPTPSSIANISQFITVNDLFTPSHFEVDAASIVALYPNVITFYCMVDGLFSDRFQINSYGFEVSLAFDFAFQGARFISFAYLTQFMVDYLLNGNNDLSSVTFPNSALVDLTTVITSINSLSDKFSLLDMTELNNIHEDIIGLNASLSGLSVDLSPVTTTLGNIQASISALSPLSFPSLNGIGSEFIDGTEVTVDGRSITYTVNRSYMGLVQDNSYTTFYDLDSLNGSKLTAPEALLTQYVVPLTVL